jgi:hypothetical protein
MECRLLLLTTTATFKQCSRRLRWASALATNTRQCRWCVLDTLAILLLLLLLLLRTVLINAGCSNHSSNRADCNLLRCYYGCCCCYCFCCTYSLRGGSGCLSTSATASDSCSGLAVGETLPATLLLLSVRVSASSRLPAAVKLRAGLKTLRAEAAQPFLWLLLPLLLV